jgi:hypothetical protein
MASPGEPDLLYLRNCANMKDKVRPRVHKGDVADLIEATSNGFDVCSYHTLQFFHHIQVQLGSYAPPVSQVGGKIRPSREVHDAKMSICGLR